MSNLKDRQVTLYKNGLTPEPLDYPRLEDVLGWIKSGKYRPAVERIRGEKDKEKRSELKKKTIPAVSFSGRFTRRANDQLKKHSGLLRLDYDGLADKARVRESLAADNRVVAIFDSVSGPLSNGLSVLVHFDPIPTDNDQHHIAFEEAHRLFGIEAFDEVVKGVSWLTYLTHDPELYVNWDAVPIKVDYTRRYAGKKVRGETNGIIRDGEKYEFIRDVLGVLRGVGLSGDMLRTVGQALREKHGETPGDPGPVDKLAEYIGAKPYDPDMALSTFRANVIKSLPSEAEKATVAGRGKVVQQLPQCNTFLDSSQNTKVGKDRSATVGTKTATIISGSDFMRKVFPPIAWIVPNVMPEGLTMLAGKPKTGKSFLAVNIGVAVACGGMALGKVKVDQGRVLYVNLDSADREFQQRLRAFDRIPDEFEISFNFPRLHEGGFDQLVEYVEGNGDVRLIIIDTFKKIRPPDDAKKRMYDQDYESLTDLANLARSHHGLGIMIIHHANKLRDVEDPFDMISGSTGLTAGLDTGMVLRQITDGNGLYIKGKEIPQTDLAITWDEVLKTWVLQGEVKEFNFDSTRQRILDAVRAGIKQPREVADFTGLDYSNVRSAMVRMEAGGILRKVGYGTYDLPKAPSVRWEP